MTVLSDEENLLAESAAAFLTERSPVSEQRRLRDNHDATGFDSRLWREMADLGWAGLLVDEAHGGTAFGHMGTAIIARAMGHNLVASPFLSTAIIGATALAHASGALQQRVLPGLVAGETIIASAIDETARHDPPATALTATRDGNDLILTGEKCAVIDGHVADHLLVLARTAGKPGVDHGLTLVLVDRSQPGISVERIQIIDSRNLARLRFDNARATADAVIGDIDRAAPVLACIMDAANLALSAELVGIAEESFARTLAYLRQRRQFGVPIGSFQALQHRASLVHCQIELAQSAMLSAARLLDAGSPDATLQASAARVKASEAATLATDEAVQMHGGMGMTDELDIGLFLKRARVASMLFGTQAYHTDRVARLLGF